MSRVQVLCNVLFAINTEISRNHVKFLSNSLFHSSTSISLQKLYAESLCFGMALRDTLANWWPFRKSDGVMVVVPSTNSQLMEFLIVIHGVWFAGGCIHLIKPEDVTSYTKETQGIRVMVCPPEMSGNFEFPVVCYDNVPTNISSTTRELMIRSVQDLISRGRFLEPILLPMFNNKDVYLDALYLFKKKWTHRELVKRLQSSWTQPTETLRKTIFNVNLLTMYPETLIDVVLFHVYIGSRGQEFDLEFEWKEVGKL